MVASVEAQQLYPVQIGQTPRAVTNGIMPQPTYDMTGIYSSQVSVVPRVNYSRPSMERPTTATISPVVPGTNTVDVTKPSYIYDKRTGMLYQTIPGTKTRAVTKKAYRIQNRN